MTRGATWTFIFFCERSCDFCRNIKIITKIKSDGWVEKRNAGVFEEKWDENREKYDQNVGGYEKTLEIAKCEDIDSKEILQFFFDNIFGFVVI